MSMMNVKRTTTIASKGDTAPVMKAESTNLNGAGDFKKAFGEQPVGDVLNKVANGNWVDPSKKVRAVGNNQLDKDAFMKLMLTQMKHQDPTNPMQSHEMAAQLAQFTSLEQLNNINTNLEAMKNAQSPGTNYQALAFIGKKVSGDSSKVIRTPGDKSHSVNFELLGDAAHVKVTVKDAGGNVVRKLDAANLKKGQNSLDWNGMTEEGMPARAGEYKFVIEGQSATGGKVWAKTAFEGKITGLNYGADGPVLMVGKQTIRMADVRKIEESGSDGGGQPPGMPNLPMPQMPGAMPGVPAMPGLAQGLALGAGPSAIMPSASQVSAQATAQAAPATAPELAMMKQIKVKPEAEAQVGSPTVQAMKAAAKADEAAAAAAQAEAELPGAPEEDTQIAGNLDSVPMSRELLDSLAKAH